MAEKKSKTEKVKEEKTVKKAKKETVEENKEIIQEDSEELKKKRTSDRGELLRALKEKAKKLAEGIKEVKTDDIKEELDKKRELLIPLDDYVKTGIHLGTKVITPDMKQFVYRRRADSIGVLNTSLIDEHIKDAIKFISKFPPEKVALVCKREAGWESAVLFEEATGIKAFTKKYPAGMMTNIELQAFFEPDLVIICDSWIDKNALSDAIKTNKEVLLLCDTNNFIRKATKIIPCNNKSSKSLGLIFWLLARGYLEGRKIDSKNLKSMNSFVGDDGQEVRE
jgi:small subunit ribosomal protein S2